MLEGKENKYYFWQSLAQKKDLYKTYIVVTKVSLVSVGGVNVLPSKLHFAIHPVAFVLGAGGMIVVNSLSVSGNWTTSTHNFATPYCDLKVDFNTGDIPRMI